MSTLGKTLVTILFVVIIFWLSVLNRQDVDFSVYPFLEGLSLPLPIIILCSVLLGFMWGALIVWLNGGKTRSEARRLRRELKNAEQQNHQSKDLTP
jgi:uncharacterized integral membrane protein